MGKFSKVGITFETSFLNKLKDDENSCVEIQKKQHHISLHPFQLNDFKNSIKDILKQGVTKYNKELGGILLGTQNIKLLGSLGHLNYDTCFIHLDVEADFFLFKPEVGKELKGVVIKKTADHVSCLLYNAFNISLPKSEDDFSWMGSSAQIGQEVLFRITFINLNLRFPYIRGEFVSLLSEADSGFSTSEENNTKEWEKKNKRIKFDVDAEEVAGEMSVESKKSKKKSKKHKLKDESMEIEETPKIKKCQLESFSEPTNSADLEEPHILDLQKKSKKSKKLPMESAKEQKQRKSKKKQEKVKKKSKKTEEEDEVSLEDLDLSDLLNNSNLGNNTTNYEMADSSDAKVKGRRNSTYKQTLEDVNLPSDSDLDEIIEKKPKRKNKDSKSSNMKKDKKNEKEDDVSLEDLDLSDLFNNSSLGNNTTNYERADSSDAKIKGRRNSSNKQTMEDVNLQSDSDLDKIVGKKPKRKSKDNESSKEKKAKKRKLSKSELEPSLKKIKTES